MHLEYQDSIYKTQKLHVGEKYLYWNINHDNWDGDYEEVHKEIEIVEQDGKPMIKDDWGDVMTLQEFLHYWKRTNVEDESFTLIES
jgi:hypothetical protein